MPVKMHHFCRDKELLDTKWKLWRDFNVDMRRGTNDYRGTTENFIDIVGSSKAVDNFYKEILRLMYEDFNFQNEDGDWFNNKISLPPHYLKWLRILGCKDTGKFTKLTQSCLIKQLFSIFIILQ